MKLIDAITFNNEFDMLESRLEYLYDVVDKFLIVESNYTHSGNSKPLHLKENLDRFSKYASKMMVRTYGVDETFDFVDSWKLEVAQRNGIMIFLDEFNNDDIIIVSDADEIPNKDKLDEIKSVAHKNGAVRFNQQMFYYNLSNRLVSFPIWGASFAARKDFLRGNPPNLVRMQRRDILGLNDTGWHLTYFMSAEQIKNKIQSFAHVEFNTEYYTDLERIQKCIDDGSDIYEREDHEFEKVDPETFFPADFLKCFSKWA